MAAITPEVDTKQLRVDRDKPVLRASNDTNRSLHYGSAAFTGQQQRAAQQDCSEATRITEENRTVIYVSIGKKAQCGHHQAPLIIFLLCKETDFSKSKYNSQLLNISC